jgi:Gluconate 2-dehydrogenase subunit 3
MSTDEKKVVKQALPLLGGMDRREALKVMAIAAAAPAALVSCEPGTVADPGTKPPRNNPLARGTAADPDLIAPVVPWDPILTEDELETLAALCDVIIPADDVSPSASSLGAHRFIDEWVSAPYEGMRRDRVLVRGGLIWIDREAELRYGDGSRFRDLTPGQKAAICDDIRYGPEAAPEYEAASRFFDKVRDLTATAFYTTPEGMADIGYVGNVPLPRWDPPPPQVLRYLGLE